MEFDKAGEYYYIVKELHGGEVIDGVTYDDTIYRVKIVVTDDLVGRLHEEIHVYDENNIPQEKINFVNVYEAPENPGTPVVPNPETDDITNFGMWVAVLFVTGGTLLGATLFVKKRRYE